MASPHFRAKPKPPPVTKPASMAKTGPASRSQDEDLDKFNINQLPSELKHMVFSYASGGGQFVRLGTSDKPNDGLVPKTAPPKFMNSIPCARQWAAERSNIMTLRSTSGADELKMVFNYSLDTLYLDLPYEFLFAATSLKPLAQAIPNPELGRVQHLAVNFYQGWGKMKGTAGAFAKNLTVFCRLREVTIIGHLQGDEDAVLSTFADIFRSGSALSSLAMVDPNRTIEDDIKNWWNEVESYRRDAGQLSKIDMKIKRMEVRR